MVEFWRSGGADTLALAEHGARLESEGWDGQAFMDSQSLGADPYALMGYWAARTDRLLLATGVTNPLTRHPAVTASAIASIHALSGGRAVLGIGRGDSALAYLGYAPAPTRRFERVLRSLQALLSGDEVAFGDDDLASQTTSADSLSLGDRPQAARLGWLPAGLTKVPLDVAATGPRVIEIAARTAERITFSVGADLERVKWAVELATASRPADMAPPAFGVQIVVVCHRDPSSDAARDAAARLVLPLARFQVLHGRASGPGHDGDDRAYEAVRRGYAMTKHSDFEGEKLVGSSLDFSFVERFAVVGTPDECTQRLLGLRELGIERFTVFGPGFHDDGEKDSSLFVREVLPAVRAAEISAAPARV